MAKYALYVSLKAKPGKEKDVEAFLKQGAEMARKETGTVSLVWLEGRRRAAIVSSTRSTMRRAETRI